VCSSGFSSGIEHRKLVGSRSARNLNRHSGIRASASTILNDPLRPCQRRGARASDFRKNPKEGGAKPGLHYSADWWLLDGANAARFDRAGRIEIAEPVH